MEDKIIEINKRIARFMGYTYYAHNHPQLKNPHDAGWKLSLEASSSNKMNKIQMLPDNSYLCRNHNGLQYHSSWDWLMPVVEKIENIEARGFYKVDCSGDACFITFEDETSTPIVEVTAQEGKTKIGSTWLAVYKFIEKYNPEIKEEKNDVDINIIFARIIEFEKDSVTLECRIEKDMYQKRVFSRKLFLNEQLIIGKVFAILMMTCPGKSEITFEETNDEKLIKENFPIDLVLKTEETIETKIKNYFVSKFGDELTLDKAMNMPNLKDVCDYHLITKEEIERILVNYITKKHLNK